MTMCTMKHIRWLKRHRVKKEDDLLDIVRFRTMFYLWTFIYEDKDHVKIFKGQKKFEIRTIQTGVSEIKSTKRNLSETNFIKQIVFFKQIYPSQHVRNLYISIWILTSSQNMYVLSLNHFCKKRYTKFHLNNLLG